MNAPADIRLRPWRMSDAEHLAALANNPRIAGFMTDAFPNPYTIDDARRFITLACSHEPVRIFAIESGGQVAGGIGLHPQPDVSRMNAELGYWVGEPFWGRGIATRAVTAICDTGFSLAGVNRIFARPFGTNTASIRVLEKCGFQLEAVIRNGFFKNGAFVDERIYSIRKDQR